MATVLTVENQRFTFGTNWSCAFKYDETNFYRNFPERKLKGDISGHPQSMRAVDVIALHSADGLLLLEAKDFRGSRIQNKDRILRGELIVEVAVKVRDTVAGLLGAARKQLDEFDAVELWDAVGPTKRVDIVLWLEDDMLWRDDMRSKQQLKGLNDALKEKLSWLHVRTIVLSSSATNRLPDLVVANLPNAGQRNQ